MLVQNFLFPGGWAVSEPELAFTPLSSSSPKPSLSPGHLGRWPRGSHPLLSSPPAAPARPAPSQCVQDTCGLCTCDQASLSCVQHPTQIFEEYYLLQTVPPPTSRCIGSYTKPAFGAPPSAPLYFFDLRCNLAFRLPKSFLRIVNMRKIKKTGNHSYGHLTSAEAEHWCCRHWCPLL